MPSIDSHARVATAGDLEAATDINLESDLKLNDNETLPAFLAGARIGRRFSVIGEYFTISRKGTSTLTRNITFDGVTYPTSSTVDSDFDSDVYRLSLGYSFVRTDKAELGAALGLHATKFKVSIEGTGSVGNARQAFERRRHEFLAPLPTIGLFGSYEVAPRLTIGARFDYLSLSIGDYDGRLLNTSGEISYRFTRNVGLGVAYRYVDYRLKVEKERYEGRFDYKFKGPAVFLEIGF